jgi:hypothetical protein
VKPLSARAKTALLAKVRKICLALPETSERLSHGEPAFFYKDKKSFLNMDTYHHGATHYSAWVAAPLGAQEILVRSDPEHFFVPPYVGYRGWVGVMLDTDPDWDQIARIITGGYAQVAEGRRSRSTISRTGGDV